MKRLFLTFVLFLLSSQAQAQDAAHCVDLAMDRLGISLDMTTDPALLQDVLANDMFLADQVRVQALLADKLAASQSLRPMLETVRSSILDKHPAIAEFLCAAIAKKLIVKTDSPLIVRTLHHMYLLDTIIGGMYSDWTLMKDVADHLIKKRESLGARSTFLGSAFDIATSTGDIFFTAKAKTIDSVFKRLEVIRGGNYISEAEAFGSKGCLILNITEAVVTDQLEGRKDNALVGTALNLNPLDHVALEGEERALRYYLDSEWTSLYETWNLAFITGKMDNLQVLYPKLLIPRVIAADSNEYLFNRTLALFTGINFYLLGRLANHETVVLPHKKELAALWGQINLKYAKDYVRERNGEDLESFRGRLKVGTVSALSEIFGLIKDPFVGVPRVCI